MALEKVVLFKYALKEKICKPTAELSVKTKSEIRVFCLLFCSAFCFSVSCLICWFGFGLGFFLQCLLLTESENESLVALRPPKWERNQKERKSKWEKK